MQWSKAKNLIIILLAAVNIVLFAQLMSYNRSARYISGEFAEVSAQALENAGLEIEKDIIPLEIPSVPTLVYSFSVSDYEPYISRIFSKPISRLESEILTENGSAVGAYYKADTGDTFYLYFDGSFKFIAAQSGTRHMSESSARALALSFANLTRLDSGSFDIADSYENAESGGYTVVVAQLSYGIPVEGYGIMVETVGGAVKSATGRLLLVQKSSIAESGLGNAADALFKVAPSLESGTRVLDMTLCYYPVADNEYGSFSAACTPAYRIKTNGGTLFYLLTSGQIYVK